MTSTTAPTPEGSVYMLWGQGTDRFKIGFTKGPIENRWRAIQAYSPIPLEVVGVRDGTRDDEQRLHWRLHRYRVHNEWFALPHIIPLLVTHGFFKGGNFLMADGSVREFPA